MSARQRELALNALEIVQSLFPVDTEIKKHVKLLKTYIQQITTTQVSNVQVKLQNPFRPASYNDSTSTCFTVPSNVVQLGAGDDGEVIQIKLSDIKTKISTVIYEQIQAFRSLPDDTPMAMKSLRTTKTGENGTTGVRLQHLAGLLTKSPFHLCNGVLPILASFACASDAKEFSVMQMKPYTLLDLDNALLPDSKQLAIQEIVCIFLDGLMTIVAIHALGIVHNDLARQNVLLDYAPSKSKATVYNLQRNDGRSLYVSILPDRRFQIFISDFGWAEREDVDLANDADFMGEADFKSWTGNMLRILVQTMPWGKEKVGKWGVEMIRIMCLVGNVLPPKTDFPEIDAYLKTLQTERKTNTFEDFEDRLLAVMNDFVTLDGTPFITLDKPRDGIVLDRIDRNDLYARLEKHYESQPQVVSLHDIQTKQNMEGKEHHQKMLESKPQVVPLHDMQTELRMEQKKQHEKVLETRKSNSHFAYVEIRNQLNGFTIFTGSGLSWSCWSTLDKNSVLLLLKNKEAQNLWFGPGQSWSKFFGPKDGMNPQDLQDAARRSTRMDGSSLWASDNQWVALFLTRDKATPWTPIVWMQGEKNRVERVWASKNETLNNVALALGMIFKVLMESIVFINHTKQNQVDCAAYMRAADANNMTCHVLGYHPKEWIRVTENDSVVLSNGYMSKEETHFACVSYGMGRQLSNYLSF